MESGTTNGKYFHEIPEDNRFLLGLPDDFNYRQAAEDLKEDLEAMQRGGRQNGHRCLAGELVPIVRTVLGLEYCARITSVTAVIFNVILETRDACGGDSPETIIQKLRERRTEIAAVLSATSPESAGHAEPAESTLHAQNDNIRAASGG